MTVTFTNDDPKIVARLEQLGSMISTSAWWRTVTEGYCAPDGRCIGAATTAPPIRLPDVLPRELRDSDVDALLRRHAAAGALGKLDASSLVVVYLPGGVRLAAASGPFCERGPRAFHRSLEIDGGTRVAFAAIPRCGGETDVTATASHEIIEATTNPFPAARGFALLGGSAASGFSAAGLEPVDPCGLVTMNDHLTNEGGFILQRVWSNDAAAKGHDPCVPSRPEHTYAMLVPREPGVRIAREGESAEVELDATCAAPVGSWTVSAFDVTGQQDGERYVEATLGRSTVTAGDSTILTVRLKKASPHHKVIVGLVSTVGVRSNMWPLLVVTP